MLSGWHKNNLEQSLGNDIKPVGAYLIEAGLLTTAQVQVILTDQSSSDMKFGEIAVLRGWVKQQTVEYLMDKIVIPERRQQTLPPRATMAGAAGSMAGTATMARPVTMPPSSHSRPTIPMPGRQQQPAPAAHSPAQAHSPAPMKAQVPAAQASSQTQVPSISRTAPSPPPAFRAKPPQTPTPHRAPNSAASGSPLTKPDFFNSDTEDFEWLG
jgi:hypothetical protein